MLQDNPILTLLGRRGRGAVVEALRRAPRRAWTVRGLALAADVPSMVASRAVRELAALGAVEKTQPGRDARVRFLPDSACGRFLAGLAVPDLREAAALAFAHALAPAAGAAQTVLYAEPGESPADPLAPTRIAIVARREEAAVEAAGPALDAVRAEGLPAPRVATLTPRALREGSPAAAAVRGGRLLPVS